VSVGPREISGFPMMVDVVRVEASVAVPVAGAGG
jgi:hypothetical protein